MKTQNDKGEQRYTTKALIDSGCTISSIDKGFVRSQKLITRPIGREITVRNADGSINGVVKDVVTVDIEITDNDGTKHSETIDLQVVNLGGKHNVFLGHDWLEEHNPMIDWRDGNLAFTRCNTSCHVYRDNNRLETVQEYLRRLEDYEDNGFREELVRAFQTKSTKIAVEAAKKGNIEIPQHYQDYADVFEKKDFDKLPERRQWDHAINLKEGTDIDRKL